VAQAPHDVTGLLVLRIQSDLLTGCLVKVTFTQICHFEHYLVNFSGILVSVVAKAAGCLVQIHRSNGESTVTSESASMANGRSQIFSYCNSVE
jgi:hypothetical protein